MAQKGESVGENTEGEGKRLTVQRHNAEDEPKTQHKHDHRVNLQTGRFVGVEAWLRGGEGLASGMKRGAFCHYVFVRSWKLGPLFRSSPRSCFKAP